MAKPKRAHRSDFWCQKCVRSLHNQHPDHRGLTDTVKWVEGAESFVHDKCGGVVKSAREAGVSR